ncbi:MAG: hypothetical protein OEQ39_26990, partial [Gammaproteobacteria bacterium]|nr:hypothetical protein [Gammaproteobacteria bacterium]
NQPPGTVAIGISIAGLQDNQLERGRAVIAGSSYKIVASGLSGGQPAMAIELTAPTTTITAGSALTVYDDDDYDDQDGNNKDGDAGEPFNELGETFKYMTDQDGNHPDGRPRNVYRSAFITPSRTWANAQPNYIQNNIAFALHSPSNTPPTGPNPILNALNLNRDSATDERDDFWIAYFLVGYQPEENEDGDGYVNGNPERPVGGIAAGQTAPSCDCEAAPCAGVVCPVTGLPDGAVGAFVFQEILQDVRTSWLEVPATPVITQNMGTTAPHELGHQFGLSGDRAPSNNVYLIMDYNDYATGPPTYALHEEHINLLRNRVRSPGQ